MWPRNRYTGIGGGLDTGPDSNPYMSNWPPPNVLLEVLRERGMTQIVNLLLQSGFGI